MESLTSGNETNQFIDSMELRQTGGSGYDFDLDQQSITGSINRIEDQEEEEDAGASVSGEVQPNLEQIQRVYYTKGLEELESLHLIDLSPLANWKLSSSKHGFGLAQLRDDSPDSYWQSDGSNDSNSNSNTSNNANAILNNQLNNPHSITIQFLKKVSLERISIFTNFSLDESYTPSRIKILAGSSDGWDLTEVCTVKFNKPIGWSHVIFNAIRADGVLKCFMVKLIILANHQDGKDSHLRAIRCFGKKTPNTTKATHEKNDVLNDWSVGSGSFHNSGFGEGISQVKHSFAYSDEEEEEEIDKSTLDILNNVSDTIGFNGFQSLGMKSISSIR